MDKRRVNIFIVLVVVLIVIAVLSAVLTGGGIRGTVPSETPTPTPALTPSVIATPTPAPTETPDPSATPDGQPSETPNASAQPGPNNNQPSNAVVNRVINQSGSFESNTGTKMIMYVNWTAVSQNSETVTLRFDVVLSSYTLSVGQHSGVISVSGVDHSFTSPAISYSSEKVRNNATLTSSSFDVTVPVGQLTNIPVSVDWTFNGVYGGKQIDTVTAGGTISIQG